MINKFIPYTLHDTTSVNDSSSIVKLITILITDSFIFKEQIEDIKKDAEAYIDRMRNSVIVKSSQHNRMYLDPNSSKLPAVGTRVRRGPDWKYHMQDSNGCGTVIGQYVGGKHIM